MEITIDAEFRSLIPPLTEWERRDLESDLREHGCTDGLVLWNQDCGCVLLDGHNRFEICQKFGIPYSTTTIELASREAAKRWILDRQLNRRNLKPSQSAMLAARRACLPRHRPGNETAQNCAVTQSAVADQHGVSRRTVQHAQRVLTHGSPRLREAVTAGIIPGSLAAVITKLPHPEQEQIAEQCLLGGNGKPARAAAAQLRNIDNPRPAEAPDLDTPEGFAVLLVDPWRAEAKRICGDRDIITYRRLLPSKQIKKIGKETCKRLPGSLLLVLRAPGELIAEALRLIESWDFAYRDQLVCRYPGAGINEYVRYEHEVLLLGTRGESVLPDPKNRPGSIIDIDDYTFIEKMWPDCSKFAFLARTEIPGWTPWPDEEGGNSWPTLVGAANPSRRDLQDTSEVSLD